MSQSIPKCHPAAVIPPASWRLSHGVCVLYLCLHAVVSSHSTEASKFTGNSKLISGLNVVVWRVSPGDRPASCPEFSPNLHLNVRGNIPKFLQAWTRWEEMEKSHLLSACLRSCYTCACFHCLKADLGLSTFCELWNVSRTDLWITRAILLRHTNTRTQTHTHIQSHF